jgi:hypothetical protein
MKPNSIRQDLPAKLKADFQQDYQDFLGIVQQYLVHPACQGEAFSEDWLILSKMEIPMPLSFFFDQTGRSRPEAALV